jgi:hypothetical protein
MLKESVTDQQYLFQVDYSEKFSLVEQNETQSVHWCRKQLFIFTAHLYYKNYRYSRNFYV